MGIQCSQGWRSVGVVEKADVGSRQCVKETLGTLPMQWSKRALGRLELMAAQGRGLESRRRRADGEAFGALDAMMRRGRLALDDACGESACQCVACSEQSEWEKRLQQGITRARLAQRWRQQTGKAQDAALFIRPGE